MRALLTAFVLAVLALPASAQPVPSHLVPFTTPCRYFDSRADDGNPLAGGSTHFFLVRGACNVPVEANAVAMTAIAFNPLSTGHAKVWGASALQPVASSFNFRGLPGGDSSYLLVGLCYPAEECSTEDVAVYVSRETHFIIDVVGYTLPAPAD